LTAYLFPGQGSQYVGMGRALWENYSSAREVFAQADHILGFALSRLCSEGPADDLNATVNTQPALLATSVAALRALDDTGRAAPSFVAGHSLGEFSALVCAGALPFASALRLVRERGRLMHEAGRQRPGGMAAVIGLSTQRVTEICDAVRARTGEHVGLANDNCPGQVVISGTHGALRSVSELARQGGARRVIGLAVSVAAHSPLMEEAATEFGMLLDRAEFRTPSVQFIANATARPVSNPDGIRDALRRQLTSPVLWHDSMRRLFEGGVRSITEVGPGSVLAGLARRIDGSVDRTTSEQELGL
jgi:[acyl-carrier-protein] S-malonyltransferase